ncbi:putative E3 ubiquitin-protein ligase [Diplonema papillatum]|nr:putative E3 ubiquitin-protein ligase [Diplonema papillatum]
MLGKGRPQFGGEALHANPHNGLHAIHLEVSALPPLTVIPTARDHQNEVMQSPPPAMPGKGQYKGNLNGGQEDTPQTCTKTRVARAAGDEDRAEQCGKGRGCGKGSAFAKGSRGRGQGRGQAASATASPQKGGKGSSKLKVKWVAVIPQELFAKQNTSVICVLEPVLHTGQKEEPEEAKNELKVKTSVTDRKEEATRVLKPESSVKTEDEKREEATGDLKAKTEPKEDVNSVLAESSEDDEQKKEEATGSLKAESSETPAAELAMKENAMDVLNAEASNFLDGRATKESLATTGLEKDKKEQAFHAKHTFPMTRMSHAWAFDKSNVQDGLYRVVYVLSEGKEDEEVHSEERTIEVSKGAFVDCFALWDLSTDGAVSDAIALAAHVLSGFQNVHQRGKSVFASVNAERSGIVKTIGIDGAVHALAGARIWSSDLYNMFQVLPGKIRVLPLNLKKRLAVDDLENNTRILNDVKDVLGHPCPHVFALLPFSNYTAFSDAKVNKATPADVFARKWGLPKFYGHHFFDLQGCSQEIVSVSQKFPAFVPALLLFAAEELASALNSASFAQLGYNRSCFVFAIRLAVKRVASPDAAQLFLRMLEVHTPIDEPELYKDIWTFLLKSDHLPAGSYTEQVLLRYSGILKGNNSRLIKNRLSRFSLEEKLRVIYDSKCSEVAEYVSAQPQEILAAIRVDPSAAWISDAGFMQKICSSTAKFLRVAVREPDIANCLQLLVPHLRSAKKMFKEDKNLSTAVACVCPILYLNARLFTPMQAPVPPHWESSPDAVEKPSNSADAQNERASQDELREKNEGTETRATAAVLPNKEPVHHHHQEHLPSTEANTQDLPASASEEEQQNCSNVIAPVEIKGLERSDVPPDVAKLLLELVAIIRKKVCERASQIVAGKRPLADFDDAVETWVHGRLDAPFNIQAVLDSVEAWRQLKHELELVRKQYNALREVVPGVDVKAIRANMEKAQEAVKACASHEKMKEALEGFWHIKIIRKYLPELLMVHEVKVFRKLWEYSRDIAGPIKKQEVVSSLVLAHKEFKDSINGLRDRLLHPNICDMVVSKDDLQYCSEEALNAIANITGRPTSNIDALVTHEKHLRDSERTTTCVSCLQKFGFFIFEQNTNGSLSLAEMTVRQLAEHVENVNKRGRIDLSLAGKYETLAQLLNVIEFAKMKFPTYQQFTRFVSLALDDSAQNPDLQHAIRELRKAHQYHMAVKESNLSLGTLARSLRDLPDVDSKVVEAKLPELDELRKDLMNAGGRDMRRLESIAKTGRVVITTVTKDGLSVCVKDVLTLKYLSESASSILPQQEILSYSAWDEFLTKITLGFTNLEDTFKMNRDSANSLLQAARAAALVFVNARKAGVPSLVGPCCLEASGLNELKKHTEDFSKKHQEWMTQLHRLQVQAPVYCTTPMAALRSSLVSWSPLHLNRGGTIPPQYLGSDAITQLRPGMIKVACDSLSCPYASMTVAFLVHVNSLPKRWNLLLGSRWTTEEDVDLFIRRMQLSPKMLYGCTNASEMGYFLQRKLADAVVELDTVSCLFAEYTGAAPSGITENGFDDSVTISVSGTTRRLLQQKLSQVQVVTGFPGVGKTKYIKDQITSNFGRRRRFVTINGDCLEDSFVMPEKYVGLEEPDVLVVRIGEAVLNKADVDRLLFQVIVLRTVIDSKPTVHLFDQRKIFVEVTTLTELLKMFSESTHWVQAMLTSPRSHPSDWLPAHTSSVPELKEGTYANALARFRNMPMTIRKILLVFLRFLQQTYQHAYSEYQIYVSSFLTRICNRQHASPLQDASLYHLLCNLRPSDPIVTSYLSRRVPPTCSGFMWTRELVEVMLELDLWFAERTPVILEGETGSGKTFLVNCWCALRSHRLRAITIHGGYDMDRISREMRTLLDDAFRYYTETRKRTVIFLDEMNTSPAVDLLKELVCEFRINGETLAHRGDQGFVTFVGAINPDRKRSAKELERYRHQGLQVLSGNGTNLAEKVYRVHGQPEVLRHYCVQFPEMSRSMVEESVRRALRCAGVPERYTSTVVDAHLFMKFSDESDYRFLSFRDVERARKVYYFLLEKAQALLGLTGDQIIAAAICVSYVSKLGDRRALFDILDKRLAPCKVEESYVEVQNALMKRVKIPEGVVINGALSENVLMMVVAISLKIPLFLVGPPGTSKSLAKGILADTMAGRSSSDPFIQQFPQLTLRVLQCSPHTTAADLDEHFKASEDDSDTTSRNVVVLEEAGLAEMSPEMPLKLLHEKFDEKPRACVCMSNWNVDPAKMNRGLFVTRSTPSEDDLLVTAKLFAGARQHVFAEYLEGLSTGFRKASDLMGRKSEFPEGAFYALRDYYSTVALLVSIADPSAASVKSVVHRNFSGLPHAAQLEVDRVFQNVMKVAPRVFSLDSTFDDIRSAIGLADGKITPEGPSVDGRYPMIINSSVTATLEFLEKSKLLPAGEHGYEVICGSGFPADTGLEYTKGLIARIKPVLGSGKALVLLNANTSYESLYDLFNRYYTQYGDQKMVDVGLGRTKIKVGVHENFRMVLLATLRDAYHAFPPPLLNRFEKHRLFVACPAVDGLALWVRMVAKLRGQCCGVLLLDTGVEETSTSDDSQPTRRAGRMQRSERREDIIHDHSSGSGEEEEDEAEDEDDQEENQEEDLDLATQNTENEEEERGEYDDEYSNGEEEEPTDTETDPLTEAGVEQLALLLAACDSDVELAKSSLLNLYEIPADYEHTSLEALLLQQQGPLLVTMPETEDIKLPPTFLTVGTSVAEMGMSEDHTEDVQLHSGNPSKKVLLIDVRRFKSLREFEDHCEQAAAYDLVLIAVHDLSESLFASVDFTVRRLVPPEKTVLVTIPALGRPFDGYYTHHHVSCLQDRSWFGLAKLLHNRDPGPLLLDVVRLMCEVMRNGAHAPDLPGLEELLPVNPVIQCILKCQPKACVAIVAVGWDEGWLRLAWGEGAAGVTLPEAVLKHLFRETSDAVSEYFVAKWPKTYYALTELLECDNMDETSQQATSDWLAKFSNNAARKKIVCSSGATSSGQAGATTEFGAFVPANFLGAVSSSETSQPVSARVFGANIQQQQVKAIPGALPEGKFCTERKSDYEGTINLHTITATAQFEACQNVSVDMIHWEEYRKANNIAKGGRPGALMQLIAQRFPCPGMSATGGIAVSVGAFGTSCSDSAFSAPASSASGGIVGSFGQHRQQAQSRGFFGTSFARSSPRSTIAEGGLLGQQSNASTGVGAFGQQQRTQQPTSGSGGGFRNTAHAKGRAALESFLLAPWLSDLAAFVAEDEDAQIGGALSDDLAPAEQFFPFAAVLSSALVSAVEDPAALKFASLENVAVKLFATSSLPRGYAHRFLRTSVSSSIRTLLQNLAERVAPQIPAVVRATEAAQIVLLHLLKEALPPTATADEIALLPLSSNSTARSIYHLLSSHSPSVEEPGEFPDDHEEDEETADTTDENENNEAGQTSDNYDLRATDGEPDGSASDRNEARTNEPELQPLDSTLDTEGTPVSAPEQSKQAVVDNVAQDSTLPVSQHLIETSRLLSKMRQSVPSTSISPHSVSQHRAGDVVNTARLQNLVVPPARSSQPSVIPTPSVELQEMGIAGLHLADENVGQSTGAMTRDLQVEALYPNQQQEHQLPHHPLIDRAEAERVVRDIQNKLAAVNTDVYRHLTDMLDRSMALISEDSSPLRTHFVSELLQNFDDATYPAEGQPTAVVDVLPGKSGIVFASNEVGFTERDLRSLCSVGLSTKSGQSGFTGEKGIGFKTVFAVTERPIVISNALQVSFDAGAKPLGMLRPHWCRDEDVLLLRKYLKDAGEKHGVKLRTAVFIPGDEAEDAARVVDKRCLLFFRRIRAVSVYGGIWTRTDRSPRNLCEVVLTRTGQSRGHEGYRLLPYESPAGVQLLFAFPTTRVVPPFKIYACLPIRSAGLPFLFHAGTLRLTLNRRDFHADNTHNLAIRKAFAEGFAALAAQWIGQSPVVGFLPINANTDEFFGPGIGDLVRMTAATACIRTAGGAAVLPKKAVVLSDDISGRFELAGAVPEGSVGEDMFFAHPDTMRALCFPVCRKLGIKVWGLEDLVECVARAHELFVLCSGEFFTRFVHALCVGRLRGEAIRSARLWPEEGDASQLHAAANTCFARLRKDVVSALTDTEVSYLVNEVQMLKSALSDNGSSASTGLHRPTSFAAALDAADSEDPAQMLLLYISWIQNKTLLPTSIIERIKLKTKAGSYAPAATLYKQELAGVVPDAIVVDEGVYTDDETRHFPALGVSAELRVVNGHFDLRVWPRPSDDILPLLQHVDENWLSGSLFQLTLVTNWWAALPAGVRDRKVTTTAGGCRLSETFFHPRNERLGEDAARCIPMLAEGIVTHADLAAALGMKLLDVSIAVGESLDAILGVFLTQGVDPLRQLSKIPVFGGSRISTAEPFAVCDIEGATVADIWENLDIGCPLADMSLELAKEISRRNPNLSLSRRLSDCSRRLMDSNNASQPNRLLPGREIAVWLILATEGIPPIAQPCVKYFSDTTGCISYNHDWLNPVSTSEITKKRHIGFQIGLATALKGSLGRYSKVYIFDRIHEQALPYTVLGEATVTDDCEDPEEDTHGTQQHIAYRTKDLLFITGDGNYSFTEALARELGTASNMIASDKSSTEYPERILAIERLNGKVLTGIDVTTAALRLQIEERQRTHTGNIVVIFNFPHTGIRQQGTDLEASVRSNRSLLAKFFAALPQNPGLRVHITLKTTFPYCLWAVKSLGEPFGWLCIRSFPFAASQYERCGYKHKTTMNLSVTVDLKTARTYEFVYGAQRRHIVSPVQG